MARPPRRPRAPSRPAPPAHPPAIEAALPPLAPGAWRIAAWTTLVALVASRAALSFAPHMWAWALNLQRFLAPVAAWLTWGLVAAALLPPVARRLAPWLERAGEAIATRPALAGTIAALVCATVVAFLPDRVRFVGDFLMREGTVQAADDPHVLFPQALPLDILLHYHVPRYLSSGGLLDANTAARVVGAAEAAGFAALAVAFVRTLALRGAAAAAALAILLGGGYLGMFTGFSKAFTDMVPLVTATAVYGLRVVRDGRGLLPLGITFAAGIALHRSALGLLPAVALAWAVWAVRHARAGGWRRPLDLIGLAIPVGALAILVPRIAAIVARWDPVHFAPPGGEGHPLALAFSGFRGVDLANLCLMLSPVCLLVPALALAGARPAADRREAGVIGLLAAPFLLFMPFIHPVQGLYRDWDDFAASGTALSLLVAWWVGRVLARGRAATLAVAVAAAALIPTLQWLLHHADREAGFRRVRAFATEAPHRQGSERATTWDYLGITHFNLERWDATAEAFARAAETAPSPRILQQWAMAETMRRNYREAQALYRRMLEKQPENALGWLGLATVSMNLADTAEARRGANGLLSLQPGNPDAQRVLDEIAHRAQHGAGR